MTTETPTTKPAPAKLAYTIKEVCEMVSCGRSTLYLAIKAEQLRARKINARTVILATDLDAWLDGLDG